MIISTVTSFILICFKSWASFYQHPIFTCVDNNSSSYDGMWPLQQGLLIVDDHHAIHAYNDDGDHNDDDDNNNDDDEDDEDDDDDDDNDADDDEDDDHLSIIDPNLGVAKTISVNVAQITNMTHLE